MIDFMIRNLSLILLVLCCVNTSVWARDFDVFLQAGQSNMDGRGKTEDLERSWKKAYRARIFYSNPPLKSKKWELVKPGFSRPPKYKGAFPSPTFGPELGFSKTYLKKYPKSNLALIKTPVGGTSLLRNWNPGTAGDEESQGDCYKNFIKTTNEALTILRDDGATYTIRGLLWHQGESDSKIATETYQTKMTEFIKRVREDLEAPHLVVVVGELAKREDDRRVKINAALNNLAGAEAKVGIVSQEGLTTSDGTHFDAESQYELGKRYAEQVADLVEIE